MPQNIIECENLVKIYDAGGLNFTALRGIDFAVKEGEFASITGPSGCGKSTLLNILGLLDAPTSGKYLLGGRPTEKMKDYEKTILRRNNIGFVFQNFNLLPSVSVLENIKMPMRYKGISNSAAERKAFELLKAVGLEDKCRNNPLQISGGQKQRVCIARALANDPKILIADEPTGNLDIKSGNEIVDLFKSINARGYTLLMVTHDASLARKTNRIIKMLDGSIVE
ncbi:MAG: ABC transporter ATP-binding protein [Elusimicrobiota bacterium]|jgi:putative ABC transport system ATP-binding protein|nr:ABC transporter ATP-binding protein [Elusimicrobiota bacterium]